MNLLINLGYLSALVIIAVVLVYLFGPGQDDASDWHDDGWM